jgi:hypothetical protein
VLLCKVYYEEKDDNNLINANKINEGQYSGIALKVINYNNHINGNSVTCQICSDCLIIDAGLELFLSNNISGNHWHVIFDRKNFS